MTNTENNPQSQGASLLQEAQQLEKDKKYDESINKICEARDILVSAGLWGDEEIKAIDEEVKRISNLKDQMFKENSQDKGMELLQKAQSLEQEGKFDDSISAMIQAKEILVGANIWGADECAAIDAEISRIEELKPVDFVSADAPSILPPSHPEQDPQIEGVNLLQQAQSLEQEGKYDEAISAMTQAKELLIGADIWGADESTAIDAEISRVEELKPSESTSAVTSSTLSHSPPEQDPQTEGVNLLQQAQSLEQEGKYDESISAMIQAKEILIGANIWGADESAAIDAEISRVKNLKPSDFVSADEISPPSPPEQDPQTEGVNLLQEAQSLEQEGKFDEAISAMIQAKELLISANIWGADESAAIDTEISRVEELKPSESTSAVTSSTLSHSPPEQDPQTEGVNLLQQAQSLEQEGKYDESLSAMIQAKEILIGANIWGADESAAIDAEISRVKSLLTDDSNGDSQYDKPIADSAPIIDESSKNEDILIDDEADDFDELAFDIGKMAEQINSIDKGSNEVSNKVDNIPIEDDSIYDTAKFLNENIADEPIDDKPVDDELMVEGPMDVEQIKDKPKVKEIPKSPPKLKRPEIKPMKLERPEIKPMKLEKPAIPKADYNKSCDETFENKDSKSNIFGCELEDWAVGIEVPEIETSIDVPFEKAKYLIESGQKYEDDEEFIKAAICLDLATKILLTAGIWGDDQKNAALIQIEGLLKESESSRSENPTLEFTLPDEIPLDEDAAELESGLFTPVSNLDNEILKEKTGAEDNKEKLIPKIDIPSNTEIKKSLEKELEKIEPESSSSPKETLLFGISVKNKNLKEGKIKNPLNFVTDSTKTEAYEKGFQESSSNSLLNLTKKTANKNISSNPSKENYNFFNFPVSKKTDEDNSKMKTEEINEREKLQNILKTTEDKKEDLISSLKKRRKSKGKNGSSNLEICPMCAKLSDKCTCGYFK